jgi:hypothetical protein
MKIIDYVVVCEGHVKGMLEDGWQPFGSPMLDEPNKQIYQAVVKYSSKSVK